ncbi:hypothetical protein BH10PLA2_BH10PLA2_30730 [soil metagenome]
MFSFIPLANDVSYIWVFALVLATFGLSLQAHGHVISFLFDPNAGDPETRKAIGQKNAVWGERFAALLATSQHGDQSAQAEQPHE